MKHKGVIFDLDGTLVDTLEDIAASMNKALEKHGFPLVDTEAYVDKVGWGMRRLAFLCLPEDMRNEETASLVAVDAVQFYSNAPLVCTKTYPGIPELVAQLQRKKVKTAVLTNKPDPTAQLVVAGLFPQGTFDIVQGEISGRPRKPDPACVWDLLVDLNLSPADIVFAGDSEVDIETAVTSGCFPLGVSWGYRSRETILKAGAAQIIDRPEELLELL
jgi:phosphoglycolate phosphatase